MGKYSQNFFQADLTLAVTAESQHYPTYLLNNKIYLPFPAISHYQYPGAISIKSICDWSIYLIAFADEQLACITQTSFHSTTSFMNPFLATMAQN